MTLDEFLAENAAEKIMYDQRLKDAKAEGEKKGAEDVQANINRIHPLISADGVSKALIESGFKALKGESSVDSFVAIADYETRVNEEAKSKLADEEQEEDTLAGKTEKSTDGKLKNKEDFESEQATFRKMKGQEA